MFNANNYGYNPYGRYVPQQPVQQPVQQEPFNTVQNRSGLQGKQVESMDVVKVLEYPLDGSVSYFPLIDGSAIITKQLQNDGTSKTLIYKLSNESNKDLPKYATIEDLEKKFKSIDLSDIDDLKDDIKELRQDIKDLKKKKAKDE